MPPLRSCALPGRGTPLPEPIPLPGNGNIPGATSTVKTTRILVAVHRMQLGEVQRGQEASRRKEREKAGEEGRNGRGKG